MRATIDTRRSHLDTSDSELDEGTERLPSGDLIGGSSDGTLDQQGVVVRLIMMKQLVPSSASSRQTRPRHHREDAILTVI